MRFNLIKTWFLNAIIQGWCVLPKPYDVKGKPDWEPQTMFCYPHYINIYFFLPTFKYITN